MQTCPCCLDEINTSNHSAYIVLECNHYIHFDCLHNWSKMSNNLLLKCALCHKYMSIEQIRECNIYSECKSIQKNILIYKLSNGHIYRFENMKVAQNFIRLYKKSRLKDIIPDGNELFNKLSKRLNK